VSVRVPAVAAAHHGPRYAATPHPAVVRWL